MGVCGRCTDITANITYKCAPNDYAEFVDQCNYTMPSGGQILQSAYDTEGDSGVITFTRWNSTSQSGSNMEGSLATFAMLQAVLLPYPTVMQTLPKLQGWECFLALCTKTWEHINVTDGVVSSSAPAETFLGLAYPPPNLTDLYNAGDDSQCFNVLYPMTEAGALDESAPTYTFNYANFASISAYMSEIFSTGWFNDGTSGSTRLNRQNSSTIAVAPDTGRELASSPNLTATMQNIGARMTEVIRHSPNSTLALGTNSLTQTYIEVQWVWLALPFTLVLMTLALLAITALDTHDRDAPAYKSSSLAMLFHRLEGWNESTCLLVRLDEVDDKAKGMRGGLSPEHPMAFMISEPNSE